MLSSSVCINVNLTESYIVSIIDYLNTRYPWGGCPIKQGVAHGNPLYFSQHSEAEKKLMTALGYNSGYATLFIVDNLIKIKSNCCKMVRDTDKQSNGMDIDIKAMNIKFAILCIKFYCYSNFFYLNRKNPEENLTDEDMNHIYSIIYSHRAPEKIGKNFHYFNNLIKAKLNSVKEYEKIYRSEIRYFLSLIFQEVPKIWDDSPKISLRKMPLTSNNPTKSVGFFNFFK